MTPDHGLIIEVKYRGFRVFFELTIYQENSPFLEE